MDSRIKSSYAKIKMSQDAREKIYTQILESDGKMDSKVTEEMGNGGGRRGKVFIHGWKAGVAACLGIALIIPSGVYAAGKISDYFTVSIGKEKYQAKISVNKKDGTLKASIPSGGSVSKKPEKYIKVSADFGEEYRLSDTVTAYYTDDEGNVLKAVRQKPEEGSDGMYSFSHRDGFDAGKDFYYNVLYMDKEDFILNLYDLESVEKITVNGHKAFLCKSNTVVGSRYASDYDTEYNIDLYVFYEEYGYVVDYCGMQGLGEKKLISLAECTVVSEAKRDSAARYEYLSKYDKANSYKVEDAFKRSEVKNPMKKMNQKLEDNGFVCQVTDVTVSSKVRDMDLGKFVCPGVRKLWDENGNLKPYIREKAAAGDGVLRPNQSVTGSEKVQPKMVYVTMKVKVKEGGNLFQLPGVDFFKREGKKYYDENLYDQYIRPEKIEDALTDYMPCYFKETDGGKGFWLKKKLKKGEEQVYHFAYLVDEDMIDNMILRFENGGSSDVTSHQYVDISR